MLLLFSTRVGTVQQLYKSLYCKGVCGGNRETLRKSRDDPPSCNRGLLMCDMTLKFGGDAVNWWISGC